MYHISILAVLKFKIEDFANIAQQSSCGAGRHAFLVSCGELRQIAIDIHTEFISSSLNLFERIRELAMATIMTRIQ